MHSQVVFTTCPAGATLCGTQCIDTTTQCCTAGKAAGVKCGSTCINPATQCCKSSKGVGLQCTLPQTCTADGGSCGAGKRLKLCSARQGNCPVVSACAAGLAGRLLLVGAVQQSRLMEIHALLSRQCRLPKRHHRVRHPVHRHHHPVLHGR